MSPYRSKCFVNLIVIFIRYLLTLQWRNVCNPWDPLLSTRLHICVCLSRDNSMVLCYVYWDTMDYLLKFQSLLLLPPGDVINSNCFPMLIFCFSVSRLFLSHYIFFFFLLFNPGWLKLKTHTVEFGTLQYLPPCKQIVLLLGWYKTHLHKAQIA